MQRATFILHTPDTERSFSEVQAQQSHASATINDSGTFEHSFNDSLASSTRAFLSTKLPNSLHRKKSPNSTLGPPSPLEHLGYIDEFKRDHDVLSLLGLCVANIGFLQGTLFGVMATVSTGGSSMLAIGWPLTAIFMLILSAVMAEFGSAWPVAGAMFTWTWKLARGSTCFRPWARFLSWIVGSFLLCGHVLTQVLISYQFATALQGTIMIFNPSYTHTKWTTIGIAWAEITVVALVASLSISRSPIVWKAVLCEIVVAFFLTLICLATSPVEKRSAASIFLTYSNTTGWTSRPYVYLIGWVSTCLATGQDIACHLSEEAREPARTVPLACFWGVVISYCLGWVSICVLLAAIPQELFEQPEDRYFAPGAILSANMKNQLAVAILSLILVAMFAQGVAQLLAASRYAYALARDKALPFSSYIAYVSPANRIPHFAVWMVAFFTFLGLLVIAAGTELVLTLILSGAAISIIVAYGTPSILFLFVKDSEYLDETGWRWTLRKASKPFNVLTILLMILVVIVLSFPSHYPIVAVSIGWAPVTLFSVLFLAVISWLIWGNSRYAGPIKILLGPSVELPSHSSVPSKLTGQTTTDMHGKTAQVIYASADETESAKDFHILHSDPAQSEWTDADGLDSRWTESLASNSFSTTRM